MSEGLFSLAPGRAGSYFRGMKPLHYLLLAGVVLMPSRALAQNSAADALERKANEERLSRLNATVTSLSDTQEVLRSRITELEQRVSSLSRELSKAKEETVHANTRQVTREEFNALVASLKEVEKKREEDKKLILDSIKDLAKLPAPAPAHPRPSVERADVGETVDYEVQEGNLLIQIIAAYNKKFAEQGRGRITLEQVKAANPELNPNKIIPGKVIKIPVPPKK